MAELREWTVMFYMATDNPLAPGAIMHLKAMQNAGYHPQVNVIAQFDPRGRNMPIQIFDVNRMEKLKHPNQVNIGFANDSYVRNIVADKLWNLEGKKRIETLLKGRMPPHVSYNVPVPSKALTDENDPGDSLDFFVKFCEENYPARHYMLFLLGHGLIVAGDMFLFDENGSRKKEDKSGSRSLSLGRLGDVLKEFNGKIKNKGELELIGFHSCSMSGAEVAFELKDRANYMLASQGSAYVGIWPYRQILIRLFNDLGHSGFSREDLETNGLIDELKSEIDKLKSKRGATYKYLLGQLEGNGAGELLSKHEPNTPPRASLVNKLADKFHDVLTNPELINKLPKNRVTDAIDDVIRNDPKNRMQGEYLKWLNRQLLMGGLTRTAETAYTKANIKNLVISIFNYCYFNSLDYQLAGYSSDVSLCDLTKIDRLNDPVLNLATALTSGLKTTSNVMHTPVRDLVVLAHLESQSFFDEKYTDLYDFCFCLKRRCEKAYPSKKPQPIRDIIGACDDIMEELMRGSEEHCDGIIVRSESVGPDYQYSHGLSVYFPWSEPVQNKTWEEEYLKFRFNRETKWKSFLNLYFKETLRNPQEDENDPRDSSSLPHDLESLPHDLKKDMEDFLEEISSRSVFNDEPQLRHGATDMLAGNKSGSLDPMGSDCDCGSIKNHPRISHGARKPRVRFKGYRLMANMYSSFERSFPKRKP
jgi:Clostripain family